jgi:hypothetical protein
MEGRGRLGVRGGFVLSLFSLRRSAAKIGTNCFVYDRDESC